MTNTARSRRIELLVDGRLLFEVEDASGSAALELAEAMRRLSAEAGTKTQARRMTRLVALIALEIVSLTIVATHIILSASS